MNFFITVHNERVPLCHQMAIQQTVGTILSTMLNLTKLHSLLPYNEHNFVPQLTTIHGYAQYHIT